MIKWGKKKEINVLVILLKELDQKISNRSKSGNVPQKKRNKQKHNKMMFAACRRRQD